MRVDRRIRFFDVEINVESGRVGAVARRGALTWAEPRCHGSGGPSHIQERNRRTKPPAARGLPGSALQPALVRPQRRQLTRPGD